MKDKVILGDGWALHNVHTADRCAGQNCVIHNPSNHHMATWPHQWDNVLIMVWRRCPHELYHPDPDDMNFLRHRDKDDASDRCLHMCDGCCQPPAAPAEPKQIES